MAVFLCRRRRRPRRRRPAPPPPPHRAGVARPRGHRLHPPARPSSSRCGSCCSCSRGTARSGVLLALGTAARLGLALVAIQFASKGWYWMLHRQPLSQHRVVPPRSLLGLPRLSRLRALPVGRPRSRSSPSPPRGVSRPRTRSGWGCSLASLPASLLPFAKFGGFSNDFVPTLFLIGPAAAFVLADLLSALPSAARGRSRPSQAASLPPSARLPLRPAPGTSAASCPAPRPVRRAARAQRRGGVAPGRRALPAPPVPAHPRRPRHAPVERHAVPRHDVVELQTSTSAATSTAAAPAGPS